MASNNKLILWGCVLWFGAFVADKSPAIANFWTGGNLSCNETFRMFFLNDEWTTQMSGEVPPRNLVEDQFFLGIWSLVKMANENGLRCTFERASVVLECCDMGNLTKFELVEWKESTAVSKSTWQEDISPLNLVLFFVNMFLVLLVMSWGLIMAIRYPETLIPLGLRGSIEMVST